MIGQIQLQDDLNKIISEGKFPRFAIISGLKGSGKSLIADLISKQLGATILHIGTDIDSIRTMIEQSYQLSDTAVYIIRNAEKISMQAQNTLLKITEEPPHKAYFILTTNDTQALLTTIRSRGTVFSMNVYSPNDIFEYARSKHELSTDDIKWVTDVCEAPGEVDLFFKYNVQEFRDYVDLVVNNVAVVSGSNSFKIANKINLASDDSKYDLRLFWKIFITECMERMSKHPLKFASGIRVTNKYMAELRNSSLNTAMLFDMWLLDIRNEWMDYADD